MFTIIKVPAVYSCKVPSGEWLNLALIRRLQYEENERPLVRVTWDNGETNIYVGADATAIMSAWSEAHEISRQRLKEFA